MQKEAIDLASESYHLLVDEAEIKEHFKARIIGNWLRTHSSKLLDEQRKKGNPTISCKPGTLIYVDFGVKLGSEISGAHFALSITKNDSSYNPLLQVIPLTSKHHKSYIDIGTEVYDRAQEALQKSIEALKKENERIDTAMTLFDELRSKSNLSNKRPDEVFELSVKFFKSIVELADIDIAKADLDAIVTLENLTALIRDLRTKSKKAVGRSDDLTKVITKYESYKKNTYAAVNQITTISKTRIIKRINEFDPIGNILVTGDSMNKIRADIAKRYM